MSDERTKRNCPECGQPVRLPIGHHGTVRCPSCESSFFADTRANGGTAEQDALESERPGATTHRLTWAAIIVTFLLVVPGTFVGGIVAMLYKWFLGTLLGGDRWLSIFEWMDKLALLWFPSLLHGMIAGAFSIAISGKLFKYANTEVVSYSVSAAYISLAVAMGTLNVSVYGLREDLVSFVAQIVGIVLGLFVGRASER